MKTYLPAFLLLFAVQQALSQTLTLNPSGPYIDACGNWPTVTVTANPSGALSYDWYRDDCGQTWLATSGQIVDLSTGNWYCIATWNGGTTSTSATVAVRIPISLYSEILRCFLPSSCITGCSLELSGPLCPNEWNNYQWTLNNIPIPGATNWFYNSTASGVYHCIFGNTLCSVTSLDSAIIQFPCDPPTNTFASNLTPTSAKLNWSTDDCAISYKLKYRPVGTITYTNKKVNGNIGHKTITGLTPNTEYQWRVHSKCGSDPNIWSAWTASSFFTTPLRLGEFSEGRDLTIYPNPAAGFLSLAIESNDQVDHLLIQNSLGQIVLEKNFDEEGASGVELNVSALSAGVYLLTVFTSEGKKTKMFVKE